MLITKKNEVYLILDDISPSERQELSDFFTFEVPNAKFMPMVRKRMWDGKIRLFSPINGEIYVGLLPYIKEYCKNNNITYTIQEGVEDERNVVRESVRNFTKALHPKTKGKEIEIRDYQIDAIQMAISRNRSLILSPTASGKSLIIYSLVRYYHMAGHRTLILVPTTSLVEQMYTDFKDYGWSSETYCQKVYQGYTTKINKDVVISTWQSLYKMPKKYFEQFGCIMGDEAHMFKAKSLTGIMTKLQKCKYRFGFTGTLDGTETHRLILEGLFGTVEQVVTTKELMDKKTLANLKINCITLKHPEKKERMTYAEEIDYLVSKESRNEFIVNLCDKLKGNTLCLFQLVDKHGKVLYDKMKGNENVYFVYGGTDTEQREKIRGFVENHKKSTTIASYGTFSTGINIRNIHNIVLASPSKSKIRVLQSIGRGLRTSNSKDSILVFDISDDISYNGRYNFTLNHFLERLNIYNEQKFNYEISKVRIK